MALEGALMSIKAIIKLVDIKTLFASLLPVLLGSAYALQAYGTFHVFLMMMTLTAMILLQSATNLFNDYMDYKRGIDGAERTHEKVLVSGEFTTRQVLVIMIIFLVTSIFLGSMIAMNTSWGILIVAAIGLLAAILYSTGPIPISYTPFGEIISGIVMGIGITGTMVFIQTGQFQWNYILISLPTAIYIGYIMFTNNLCDIEKDKEAGRNTLPSLIGFTKSQKIWIGCSLILFLATLGLVLAGLYPDWVLFTFLTLGNYRWILPLRKLNQKEFIKEKMMGIMGRLGIQYHMLVVAGLLLSYLLS